MDETVLWIAFVLAALTCGVLVGWFSCAYARGKRLSEVQARASKIIDEARHEAEAVKKTALLEARDEWRQEHEPLERELETRKRAQAQVESKLAEREQQLDRKFDILDGKERSLLKTESEIGRAHV